ncbi:DUF4181 domain-containing protein [Planococcus halocryophilus]|uniref:DUF4181 domain-containing protein n=1 Tax=Planococcus halocryophilus TaxID=1215089 RepID=A0A1C7DSL8_9BACL|nr:DUF4181 domain-containing protein [Planococcus halocryophilus]ANU14387.1 DUF4181 domain-containing protein [Planococcus halocryophilus]
MEVMVYIGLFVLVMSYFFVSNVYLKKKRGIKRDSRSFFHEDKNRYIMIVQGIIFIGFIYVCMYLIAELDSTELSVAILISPLAGLFILQTFVTGLEEWLLHRDKKRYWYDWSETIFVGLVFGLLLLTKG